MLDHVMYAVQKKSESMTHFPVQFLTKRERKALRGEIIDLENEVQIVAIAKTWINQNRSYANWRWVTDHLSDILTDKKHLDRIKNSIELLDMFKESGMSDNEKIALMETVLTDGILPMMSKHSLKYPELDKWYEQQNYDPRKK